VKAAPHGAAFSCPPGLLPSPLALLAAAGQVLPGLSLCVQADVSSGDTCGSPPAEERAME